MRISNLDLYGMHGKGEALMKESMDICDLQINSKMTIKSFHESSLYSCQDTDRFFWIQGNHTVEGLEGSYRIGLYFKNEVINTVEVYSINFEEEQDIKKKVLQRIKETYSLGEKSIIYSFDKRNDYGSIIISF